MKTFAKQTLLKLSVLLEVSKISFFSFCGILACKCNLEILSSSNFYSQYPNRYHCWYLFQILLLCQDISDRKMYGIYKMSWNQDLWIKSMLDAIVHWNHMETSANQLIDGTSGIFGGMKRPLNSVPCMISSEKMKTFY